MRSIAYFFVSPGRFLIFFPWSSYSSFDVLSRSSYPLTEFSFKWMLVNWDVFSPYNLFEAKFSKFRLWPLRCGLPSWRRGLLAGDSFDIRLSLELMSSSGECNVFCLCHGLLLSTRRILFLLETYGSEVCPLKCTRAVFVEWRGRGGRKSCLYSLIL